MKKFLFIVTLLCLVVLVFTGCKRTVTREYSSDADFILFDKFTVIENTNDSIYGDLYIMYDNDTKVEYFYIPEHDGTTLCPVYNADGTVKIYTENSN